MTRPASPAPEPARPRTCNHPDSEQDEYGCLACFRDSGVSVFRAERDALTAQVAELRDALWDAKRVLLTRHLGDGSELQLLSENISVALASTPAQSLDALVAKVRREAMEEARIVVLRLRSLVSKSGPPNRFDDFADRRLMEAAGELRALAATPQQSGPDTGGGM